MNNFPSYSNYSGIHLFNETAESLPITENDITQILGAVKQHENCDFKWVEVVFVDEKKIIEINREHLNHDYSTDIITFHYSDDRQNTEGTLYCCYSQIKQQAEEHNQTLKNEFLRVIIHGVLHLCGYDDKTEAQKKEIGKKEDFYLSELF